MASACDPKLSTFMVIETGSGAGTAVSCQLLWRQTVGETWLSAVTRGVVNGECAWTSPSGTSAHTSTSTNVWGVESTDVWGVDALGVSVPVPGVRLEPAQALTNARTTGTSHMARHLMDTSYVSLPRNRSRPSSSLSPRDARVGHFCHEPRWQRSSFSDGGQHDDTTHGNGTGRSLGDAPIASHPTAAYRLFGRRPTGLRAVRVGDGAGLASAVIQPCRLWKLVRTTRTGGAGAAILIAPNSVNWGRHGAQSRQ